MGKVSLDKIKKVAETIAKDYRPERIILFGSYAWGKPHADSDVDLFVVMNTKNPWKLSLMIDGSIFPRPFPLDLLLYTPQQLKRRGKVGDFFIQDILSKGIVLYEKYPLSTH